MQGLEVRVSSIEEDVRDINEELKDLKKEMSEQDEKIERKIDEKFKEIENKIDKNSESQATKSDKIVDSLDTIKEAIFKTTLATQKLEITVDLLQQESKEEQKDRKKIKWLGYTTLFGLLSSFIGTWLKLKFGW